MMNPMMNPSMAMAGMHGGMSPMGMHPMGMSGMGMHSTGMPPMAMSGMGMGMGHHGRCHRHMMGTGFAQTDDDCDQEHTELAQDAHI